jgi:Family of unknown function (DUF6461)
MSDTTRFDWAEDVEALSLTFVRGLDDATIASQLDLRNIGADPLTLEQAWDMQSEVTDGGGDDGDDDGGIVQLDHLGGWTVIIEDNGYLGSLEENLGPLSANGTAVNVFWNVNMVTSFGYAVAGTVVRYFDPIGVDASTGDPLPEEAELHFEDEAADAVGLALLLLERLTGTTIDGDWVMAQSRLSFTSNQTA